MCDDEKNVMTYINTFFFWAIAAISRPAMTDASSSAVQSHGLPHQAQSDPPDQLNHPQQQQAAFSDIARKGLTNFESKYFINPTLKRKQYRALRAIFVHDVQYKVWGNNLLAAMLNYMDEEIVVHKLWGEGLKTCELHLSQADYEKVMANKSATNLLQIPNLKVKVEHFEDNQRVNTIRNLPTYLSSDDVEDILKKAHGPESKISNLNRSRRVIYRTQQAVRTPDAWYVVENGSHFPKFITIDAQQCNIYRQGECFKCRGLHFASECETEKRADAPIANHSQQGGTPPAQENPTQHATQGPAAAPAQDQVSHQSSPLPVVAATQETEVDDDGDAEEEAVEDEAVEDEAVEDEAVRQEETIVQEEEAHITTVQEPAPTPEVSVTLDVPTQSTIPDPQVQGPTNTPVQYIPLTPVQDPVNTPAQGPIDTPVQENIPADQDTHSTGQQTLTPAQGTHLLANFDDASPLSSVPSSINRNCTPSMDSGDEDMFSIFYTPPTNRRQEPAGVRETPAEPSLDAAPLNDPLQVVPPPPLPPPQTTDKRTTKPAPEEDPMSHGSPPPPGGSSTHEYPLRSKNVAPMVERINKRTEEEKKKGGKKASSQWIGTKDTAPSSTNKKQSTAKNAAEATKDKETTNSDKCKEVDPTAGNKDTDTTGKKKKKTDTITTMSTPTINNKKSSVAGALKGAATPDDC
jgi:hypothetical protein